MDYARSWHDERAQKASGQGASFLSSDGLARAYPATRQRLSEGVFWFFIALTILLALLNAHGHARVPATLSLGWVGVFVLYYALRSSRPFPGWQLAHQIRRCCCWVHWPRELPPQLLLDLLVMTALVVLSGGWASPLYMLYLGWAVALLDEVSIGSCLGFTGLACGAFVLAAMLAPHRPFSSLQITLLSERVLILLLVPLGISGFKIYIKRAQSAWEAERRQWDALRQAVFLHLSHELYTPLSAISASAALLAATETEPAAERRRYLLDIIERNCARMSLLIDDLMAMWREHQRQIDCAPACLPCLTVGTSVGHMIDPLLESKQQRLVVVADPPDTLVWADVRRLEQVLVNLLANAQKYAPAGTVITLTIRRHAYEVFFAVRDEGAGVPLEEQGALFEYFYRGTNCPVSSRGSGIGLALAKALVVLMGGRIWVESMPGQGSTFYFTLPAAEPG